MTTPAASPGPPATTPGAPAPAATSPGTPPATPAPATPAPATQATATAAAGCSCFSSDEGRKALKELFDQLRKSMQDETDTKIKCKMGDACLKKTCKTCSKLKAQQERDSSDSCTCRTPKSKGDSDARDSGKDIINRLVGQLDVTEKSVAELCHEVRNLTYVVQGTGGEKLKAKGKRNQMGKDPSIQRKGYQLAQDQCCQDPCKKPTNPCYKQVQDLYYIETRMDFDAKMDAKQYLKQYETFHKKKQ